MRELSEEEREFYQDYHCSEEENCSGRNDYSQENHYFGEEVGNTSNSYDDYYNSNAYNYKQDEIRLREIEERNRREEIENSFNNW